MSTNPNVGTITDHLSSQNEERLPMKVSRLVETVGKKTIGPHIKHLIVEVMVSDEEGEDVEVRTPSFTQ